MTYIKQTHHAHEVPDNDIVQKSNRPTGNECIMIGVSGLPYY